jgi:hypothetical protein
LGACSQQAGKQREVSLPLLAVTIRRAESIVCCDENRYIHMKKKGGVYSRSVFISLPVFPSQVLTIFLFSASTPFCEFRLTLLAFEVSCHPKQTIQNYGTG